MIRIQGDPATNRHNPAGPTSADAAAAMLTSWQADWQTAGFGYWIARVAASRDEVAGIGGIRPTDVIEDGRRLLNLYYRFDPCWWGRGLATELGLAAIEQARELATAFLVTAIIHPDNRGSAAVARRCGLVEDGPVSQHGGIRVRWTLALDQASGQRSS